MVNFKSTYGLGEIADAYYLAEEEEDDVGCLFWSLQYIVSRASDFKATRDEDETYSFFQNCSHYIQCRVSGTKRSTRFLEYREPEIMALDDGDELLWACIYDLLAACAPSRSRCKSIWVDHCTNLYRKKKIEYPSELLDVFAEILLYAAENSFFGIAFHIARSHLSIFRKRSPQKQVFASICSRLIVGCASDSSPELSVAIFEAFYNDCKRNGNKEEYIEVLFEVGSLYLQLDADKAYKLLAECLMRKSELDGGCGADICLCLCALFKACALLGKTEEALAVGVKAYGAAEKNELPLDVVECIAHMSDIMLLKGQLDFVEEWLNAASELCAINQHRGRAYILIQSAFAQYYMKLGRPFLAEQSLRECLERADVHDGGHAGIVVHQLTVLLAKLYGGMYCDRDSACTLIDKAITELESGDDHFAAVYLSELYTLKQLYSSNPGDEMLFAQKALEHSQPFPTLSNPYQKLEYARALVRAGLENLDEAKELIAEVQAQIRGQAIPETMAELHSVKALYAVRIRDFRKAKSHARSFLDTIKRIDGINLRRIIEASCMYFLTLILNQDYSKALTTITHAIALSRDSINLAKRYLDDSVVRDFLFEMHMSVWFYLSFANRFNQYCGKEYVCEVIVNSKALPSLVEKLKKDHTLQTQRQIELHNKFHTIRGEERDETARANNRDMAIEYGNEQGKNTDFPLIRISEILEYLPENSVFIHYMAYGDISFDYDCFFKENHISEARYSVVIAIKKNGKTRFDRLADVDLTDVHSEINGFRDDIEQKDEPKISQRCKNLFTLLLAEAEHHYKGCERIFISPDYELSTIPFELLGKDTRLMDSYRITYIESARDFKQEPGRISSDDAIVIGSPQYAINVNPESGHSPERTRNFSQLPLSDIEAIMVAQKLNTTPFTGNDAGKDVVLSCDNPRILHIATHGYVEGLDEPEGMMSANPMLRSCLVMTGAMDWFSTNKLSERYGTGIITAKEICALDLSGTELVVLSACVTGLGSEVNTEIVGMRSAFKVAGAQSIIMSLWSIDDFATAIFMDLFYSALERLPIEDALRRAKLDLMNITVCELREAGWFKKELLRKAGAAVEIILEIAGQDGENRPFANAYYWAGFVCQMN